MDGIKDLSKHIALCRWNTVSADDGGDRWVKAKDLSNLEGKKNCLLDLTQAWESLCKKEAGCVSQPPELLHKNEPSSPLPLQWLFLCHLSSSHHMKQEPHGCLPLPPQHGELPPPNLLLLSKIWAAFPLLLYSQEQTQLDFSFMKSFVQVLACCYFEQKCKLFFSPGFVKNNICFHSKTILIPSHKLSLGLTSAVLLSFRSAHFLSESIM